MSTEFINDQWRLPNNENKDKQSNYSMSFDSASSEYIDCGNTDYLNNLTEMSLSIWFNLDTAAINKGLIGDFVYSPAQGHFSLLTKLVSGNNYSLRLYINNSPNDTINISGTPFTAGQWHHLVMIYENSTFSFYVDGSPVSSSGDTPFSSFPNSTSTLNIGRYSTLEWDGKIDAVSIFNYALSSSQVTTLYGSSSTGIGNPMSLSPKPVAFYQLGDKSAFNGANYLVPNIAAQEDDGDIATSYSPYALDFDGANDYIQTPYVLPANTTTFSISMWLNATSFTTLQGFIGSQDSSSDGYWVYIYNNNINFKINGTTNSAPTSSLSVNTWFNLVATYDGTSVKIYLNSVNSITNSLTETINITANTIIGRLPWTPAYYFNGSMSNVSIWNTALTSAQVTEIYNEGVPSNLNNHSAYSNLVSWWQLGSNSSFNTNWTVLDEKGSNNGTSVNMDEVDIVDGVGSYANGLSSGMGGDEVIGSAPFSDANSLSVNMDVLDRSTDVPN